MFSSQFFAAKHFGAGYFSSVGVTVTYSGPLVLPLSQLRTLIAATSEFQTWVGAGSAAAAEASIHIGGVASPTRPFVIVSLAEFEARRYATGTRDWFLHSGAIRVMFEEAIAAENQSDQAAAENAFLAQLDTIMSAALDLSGSGEHISIDSFDLEDDPARADEDEGSEYYQALCLAHWSQG